MNELSIIDDFHAGHCINAYDVYGAHLSFRQESGVTFTVYAPNALSVQVIGDFNQWDGQQHYMERLNDRGDWQLFIPQIKEWSLYKYRIETADQTFLDKADPFAFYSELRPNTSSIVANIEGYEWNDQEWMENRTKNFDRPLSIYEVHLGSWRLDNGEWLKQDDFVEQLIPYVKDNGFTHVELMPLSEHPFDGSWGYQVTGYFSPTSRYGSPMDVMYLVDQFHQAGIGVLMDVVPAHFVKDAHGLANFDGRPVYEYPNLNDAQNEWGTLNFNLWNEEVRSFLMSSFGYWLEVFHIDGLRFDAAANMLHWEANKNRGENQGALAFIRRANYHLAKNFPQCMLIAEDSSDFAGVTKPTFELGLGYDYKWDLGWMNDTLKYFKHDPIHRKYYHHQLTFSMAYFYSERFLLPLSHDEVVHMKGSLINKFWGNYEQRFAQLRILLGYMFAHPGKKLNFMGNEFAHYGEWQEFKQLDWELLNFPLHDSFLRYFKDLNQIYKMHPAMHKYDYLPQGFYWIDPDNADQSIYSFVRESDEEIIVAVLNMTPVHYQDYNVGVPYPGTYIELLNSQKDIYSGNNDCNYEPLLAYEGRRNNQPYHLNIKIAGFSCIYFHLDKNVTEE